MTEPISIIVEHATQSPAIDCMYAAQLAAALSGRARFPIPLARLRGETAEGFTDQNQHVSPWGSVIPTGLLWVDRIADGTLVPACDERLGSRGGRDHPEIIAVNPAAFPYWERPQLDSAVKARVRNAVLVQVEERGGSLHAAMVVGDDVVELPRVMIDGHGRPSSIRADQLPASFYQAVNLIGPKPAHDVSEPGKLDPPGRSLSIVLIGEKKNFRVLGPALLASVGDAADAAGTRVEIDIISPRTVQSREALEVIAGADGLLLPGGSDMGEVEGQIAAATFAFRKRVPTLGVCLGMQSMVASLTRVLLGIERANLEEVDPQAETLVFRRLRSADGGPLYRLGPHRVCINQGTRFASFYPKSEVSVRMAHRYHLNPELLPTLLRRGMVVGGQSQDGRVVDAIEFPNHPFFVGIQGHPEYSSRRNDPPGLFTGFLSETSRYKSGRARLKDGLSADPKISRHAS